MSISKYMQLLTQTGYTAGLLSLPELLGRYSRASLLGGGVAASLIVVTAGMVFATIIIGNDFNERLNLFEAQRDRVKANIDRTQGRLKQAVESYELLWHLHEYKSVPVKQYHRGTTHEYSVSLTDTGMTVTPAMLFSLIDYDTKDIKIKDFLHLIRELSSGPLLRYRDIGYSLGGFVYSSDHKLMALSPPLTTEQLGKAHEYGIDNYVKLAINQVEEELVKYSPDFLRKHRLIWVPIHTSPTTGELVGQYAAPIYCGEERIAVIVATVPIDKFSVLFQDSVYQPGFFLLSRDNNQVLGRGPKNTAEDQLVDSALKYKADFDRAGQRPVINRRGGLFFYSQQVPGPGWMAVYVFDWYAVVSTLKKPLIYGALLMLLVLIGLWGFILFFDRLVLTPLRAHARLIYDSDQFNRAVLNTAPVALTIYEPTKSLVVLQNRQAIKLLECSADGESIFERILHGCGYWSESGYEGSLHAEDVKFYEVYLHDKDGICREISVTYSKARYKQTDVVLFGMTDITEQKATLRLLQLAKETADEASSAKSMFLATVSHDIRTPLHGALGNLELLALEELTQSQKVRVLTIRQAFDSLQALVSDVLDLSKIEAQEFKLNSELFDLVELVERCARNFAPVILSKRLRFLCLIDPLLEGPWRGDAQRISQVLMNLLSNAQKFTEYGSITLRVTPGKAQDDMQWVRISLSDTGMGISVENRNKLFEPFVQADPTISRRHGGTGLGLALCRRITSLLGGTISVDSELDVGSIFTVYVPLKKETTIASDLEVDMGKKFSAVVVVCDLPLWEMNLLAQIRMWFPDIEVIIGTLSEPFLDATKALLILAVADNASRGWWVDSFHKYADVIVCSANGPLHAERQAQGVQVSSFSTRMLKQALLYCSGCDDIFEPHNTSSRNTVVSKGARILIAEDDPVSQALLICQLATLGYHDVECVNNGAEALGRCIVNAYDLIITDLGMSVMDGNAFLTNLRAENILTPVIVCTADAGKEINSLSNVDVMYKPVAIERLNLLLDQVFGRSKSPESLNDSDRLPTLGTAEMRELFQDAWEADEKALFQAIQAHDSKRVLALLHRLQGAFLALSEFTIADACYQLSVNINSEGLTCATPSINELIREINLLGVIYRSG